MAPFVSHYNAAMKLRWDLFCSVVDNYGDIGICWRIARALTTEHGQQVRLWVDDLESFHRIWPDISPGLAIQHCEGVEVRRWTNDMPTIRPADVVVEAFACRAPASFLRAMEACTPKPVWINLEYFSAEDWVPGCHALGSLHPRLSLTQYFFIPGLGQGTGGVPGGRKELAVLENFQNDSQAVRDFWAGFQLPADGHGDSPPQKMKPNSIIKPWRAVSVPPLAGRVPACTLEPFDGRGACSANSPSHPRPPPEGEGDAVSLREFHANDALHISLFAYENPAVAGLIEALAQIGQRTALLVPEGRVLAQLAACLGRGALAAGDRHGQGNLDLCVLPFMPQNAYDRLLWASDINFVRGEDSFVRAQHAGKPMVWQPYVQEDGAHWHKLAAFLKHYTAGLDAGAEAVLRETWRVWNAGECAPEIWQDWFNHLPEYRRHARAWADKLAAQPGLEEALVKFTLDKVQPGKL